MLEQLGIRMPETYGGYYEPFVGGGALVLSLAPEKAVLNDINQELVHTYREIRDHLDALLVLLSSMDTVTCTKEFTMKCGPVIMKSTAWRSMTRRWQLCLSI